MKANTEGYYELTLNNGRKKCNTIILENSETKEKLPIKILGTYKEGLVEELISWIKLKHISMVDIVKDRRLFETSGEEIVIKEILPEDEYFVYSSEPYYEDAIKVSEDEFNYEYQKIRSIPNGMKQYREKVETLINSTSSNYIIAKNYKNILIEEPLQHIEEQTNDKITEPGYYKLTISDGKNYHKTVDVGREIPIIGEYCQGTIKIIGTDTELKYVRDVEETHDRRRIIPNHSIIEEDDYYSYYSNPCYFKAQKISIKNINKILNLLSKNTYLLTKYISTIQEIILNSTYGYSVAISNPTTTTFKNNKKKKPREENKYKHQEPSSKPKISRKLKKELKKQTMKGVIKNGK